MRVALFTDTFYPQVNGVARTLKRFTDYMIKQKIDFAIYTPEVESVPSYPNLNQFSSIPMIVYPECRAAVANPIQITKSLKNFSPDIVHVATPLSMGLLGIYSSKKISVPMVASYHTHFDQYLDYYKLTWAAPLLWKYIKWFHSPFEKIFVPSLETKEYLQKQGFQSLSIWSRGVDCELFHPQKNNYLLRDKYQIKENNILLYVGRLAPEKDLKTLINIINYFPDNENKDVHWLIAGDGPSYREFKQQTEHHQNVTMTGYLYGEELSEVYASSDIFIFPSSTETFGNVVLEAMASGLPAVCANAGGVKELVRDGKNGFLCSPGDEVDFIEKIKKIIMNDEYKFELSQQARNFALKQSWNSIFDQLLREYEEVIYSKKRFPKHA